MAQGTGSSKGFVPSGVDAQSWIGFEHRIQERRFKALVESIGHAVANRDGVAARIALEEACELRPEAPELEALTARVALLPTGTSIQDSPAYVWYRGLSAVAMFVVGIGLVIGIESIRSGGEELAPVKAAVKAATSTAPITRAPEPAVVAQPVLASDESAVAIEDQEDHTAVATDAVIADAGTTSSSPTPEPSRSAVPRGEPVGTAGASRAVTNSVAPVSVPNRATFRPPVDDVAPVLPASREIPDDYVATSPRSETRPAFVEVPAPPPAIAANVMPQPISITAPPPALPANNATVTSATVAPRSDNSRVEQVLHQYAQAYGKLDPNAAQAVWPTVDERALARAFASLESQDVSFDKCDIDIKGTIANASCSGTASYVGKIGSRQERSEARQWNFELKLHGDDWKIEKAQTSAR
jgi:hypothetical protein